jgi:hypothetical protein
MKKSRSHQARASSSSKPTAASEPSDPVLALGKKLIRELELGDTTDTLSRWMIHYLAGLIKKAEHQSAKNRPAILKECFDAILGVWQHRHELPDGKRPFQGIEPVLRALESLDPINAERRYFPSALPPAGNTEESKETRRWLELAEGLDNSARILIRECLTNAAAAAIDKSKGWVALAERAAPKDGDLPILKIIIGERNFNGTPDPDETQRKLLEDRLGKLRAFIRLAEKVAIDYERKIKGKKPANKTKPGKAAVEPRLAKPPHVIVEDHTVRGKKAARKTRVAG